MSSARPGEALAVEPPLLVWEDARLSVAPSLEQLVRAVSPAAIQHGAIMVHDARGRRLVLAVERQRYRWLGVLKRAHERVVLMGVDPSPVHGDRLAEHLGAWLAERGVRDARALPLAELVRRAAASAERRGG